MASLLDLAAMKVSVIQQRAESKDYVDIQALLDHGLSLEEMLAAATAIRGKQFNPSISLKALTWFKDGDLPGLPEETKNTLARAATRIGPIPTCPLVSNFLCPSSAD